MSASKSTSEGSVKTGFIQGLVVSLIVQGGLWLAARYVSVLERPQFYALSFVGVVQLIYLLPLARRAKKRGRKKTARGIWLLFGLVLVADAVFLFSLYSFKKG